VGYRSEFSDDDEYQHWRSRLGALVLIDGPENAGFGAALLSQKVDWYKTQNLLAASISPDAKGRGFARYRRFMREQGLHRLQVTYSGESAAKGFIEHRGAFYREISQRLWSPSAIGLQEATLPVRGPVRNAQRRRRRSFGVNMVDLLRASLLVEGDILVGVHMTRAYRATVLADGRIRTLGGSAFDSPSAAAMDVLNRRSWNGWHFWHLERTGESLDVLRSRLLPGS